MKTIKVEIPKLEYYCICGNLTENQCDECGNHVCYSCFKEHYCEDNDDDELNNDLEEASSDG
ncbi:MAG: hypothetical protein HC877_20640 [Thioploca sp.]|nr:hypothetical protein [Thioploca sp.]